MERCSTLKIKPFNVGKLIGRGGQTIKHLEHQHNVHLSILQEYDSEGMRDVQIRGDHQDIQNVMQSIQAMFMENSSYQQNYSDGAEQNDRRSFKQYNQNLYDSKNRNNNYHDNNNNYQQRRRQNFYKSEWRTSNSNYGWNMENSRAESEMQSQFMPSINTYQQCKSASNNDDGNMMDTSKEDQNQNDNANAPVTIDWEEALARSEAYRKERWAKCPRMVKDFYVEHPKTTEMTEEDVEQFRMENNKITVCRVVENSDSEANIPKPVTNFEYAFHNFPEILIEIKKQGFEKPSPIQCQMWPILLKGEDCVGIAQTGTGKTLAFLLPALIHIDSQPHPRGIKARGGPNVLILVPVRELAIQIEKEVAKYQYRGIRAVCLYGGNDRKKQIEAMESGAEIIIATPGRLNDLIAANHVKIESVTYLVLDEADRMLDMGFEPQIRKILVDIRDDRQTVMTSATWPAGVRRIASSYMNNAIQVTIGSLDLAATHTVTQHIEILDESAKLDRIFHFIREEMTEKDKIIIFCCKKSTADFLSSEFALKGMQCQSFHSGHDQEDREQALDDIKSGTIRILITTDIASRGFDIEDITVVINYDFPRNIEEYVHRVGRTGRAGRSGVSLSFVTRNDWGVAKDLIEILKEADQNIPEELQNMADRFEAKKNRIGVGSRGSFRGGSSFRGRGNNRW